MLLIWGLMLASACYTGLAVWRLAIARTHPGAQYLALPFAGMAVWAAALLTRSATIVAIAEMLRDLGWLAYILITTRPQNGHQDIRRTIAQFCLGLALLAIVRTGLALSIVLAPLDMPALRDLLLLSVMTWWIFSAASLLFANTLYRSTAVSAGSGFRLITITLGVMWAYNLNTFTMMILGYPQAATLSDWRGIVALVLLPAFAIGARRKEHWKVLPSRQATTRSLLFLGIGVYFVVVSSATRAAIWAGESAGDTLRILLATAVTLGVLALAAMPRRRAYIKTFFIKHMFEHRYDYRSEWLRFSATIGDRGASQSSAEERVIRSLADVTQSHGGLLLLVEPPNYLALAGTWRMETMRHAAHPEPASPEWLDGLIATARIVDLNQIRTVGGPSAADGAVPPWLIEELGLWMLVPLVRSKRLVGLVGLAQPSVARDLDWEDFDLLKVIAQQVTVHLTDEQSHSRLEEARRFDEFNRRFAFIIHDLKNVVSQLSLVSSNARDHGSNPKFQTAMVKTLANSTDKMTSLLSRLSADRITNEPSFSVVIPEHVLRRVATGYRNTAAITVTTDAECAIRADEEHLAEALGHLLSNAIEASSGLADIQISVANKEGAVVIAIQDRGCGMSPNFIRNDLFKPFVSTKPGGFGIGAAEARSMIIAMGGELRVESVEGEGTTFFASFPAHRPTIVSEA